MKSDSSLTVSVFGDFSRALPLDVPRLAFQSPRSIKRDQRDTSVIIYVQNCTKSKGDFRGMCNFLLDQKVSFQLL